MAKTDIKIRAIEAAVFLAGCILFYFFVNYFTIFTLNTGAFYGRKFQKQR